MKNRFGVRESAAAFCRLFVNKVKALLSAVGGKKSQWIKSNIQLNNLQKRDKEIIQLLFLSFLSAFETLFKYTYLFQLLL